MPRELDDPLVELLRSGAHGLLELRGDEAVRAAEERLGDAVELLAEAIGGLLADARMRFSNSTAPASLRASISRASPLELLDLPALDLGERELDTRARFALGAFDLLGHRMLVLTKPLVHLVDRPPAVVSLH